MNLFFSLLSLFLAFHVLLTSVDIAQKENEMKNIFVWLGSLPILFCLLLLVHFKLSTIITLKFNLLFTYITTYLSLLKYNHIFSWAVLLFEISIFILFFSFNIFFLLPSLTSFIKIFLFLLRKRVSEEWS